MKRNKKWFVLLLSALLALTNISCATQQKEPETATDASIQEKTTGTEISDTKSVEENNQRSSEENPNPWVWYGPHDGDNGGGFYPYSAVRNNIYYEVYEDHAEVDAYQPRPESTLEIGPRIDGRAVTKIRAGAFKMEVDRSIGGFGVNSLIIPDSVTTIESGAFKGNIYMRTLELPENLITIGDAAFSDCDQIGEVTFPKSLKTIGSHAFFNCKSMNRVTFPKGLKTIGNNAFYNCGLKTVILPDTLESLGSKAFSGNNIEEVYIPDTLQIIEGNPFQDTPWMKKQTDEFVIVGDGVLLDYRGTQESVVVPDTVKRIVEPGFQLRGEGHNIDRNELIEYPLLKRIEIPDTVVWIDDGIFSDALAENAIIKIPASVENIENNGSYYGHMDSATIYCAAHSCAQKYAKEFGIKTKPIEEWPNR